ncbi:hypothetical protein HPB50_010862 [Hyalomma asiaticum]|uniref:Uncharacterized protein n=1 Tax=Hyalomma asiaticum TaxID=266040 RepID=A0ACB7RK40_HYAAI|nr:hypothetical protein HPB50_010862 [Hyalomma asiaticum]
MASREKAKGQHATTKSGRLPRRWVACFVLAIIQLIIGLGLLAVGAADVVFTLDDKCKDRTGASFLQASRALLLLSAIVPRRFSGSYFRIRVRALGQVVRGERLRTVVLRPCTRIFLPITEVIVRTVSS